MKIWFSICAILISIGFYAQHVCAKDVPQISPQLSHTMMIQELIISDDDSYIISCDDKNIRVWDLPTGNEVRSFSFLPSQVAISGNGKTAVTKQYYDDSVIVWDVPSGNQLSVLRNPKFKEARRFQLSRDGKILYSIDESEIKIWDVNRSILLNTVKSNNLFIIEVSSSGKYYSAMYTEGNKREYYIFETLSNKLIKQFSGIEYDSLIIFSDDDDKFAFASHEDGMTTVDIYSLNTKSKIAIVDVKGWAYPQFDNTSNNILIESNDKDGFIVVDITTNRIVKTFKTDLSINTGSMFKRISKNNKYALFSYDSNKSELFDYNNGASMYKLANFTHPIRKNISVSGDRILVSDVGNNSIVWDKKSGQRINLHKDSLDAEFIPGTDGYLTIDGEGTFEKHGAATSEESISFVDEQQPKSLHISSDGKLVFGISYLKTEDRYGTPIITAREINEGSVQAIFAENEVVGEEIEVSKTGNFAVISGHDDKTITVWKRQNNRQYVRLWSKETGPEARNFHQKAFYRVPFKITESEKYIITGAYLVGYEPASDGAFPEQDTFIKVWDINNGNLIRQFNINIPIISIDISKDGGLAVVGLENGEIRLYDLNDGQLIRTYIGHSESVANVAISEDAKRIISGGGDPTTRIWDLLSGKEIAQFVNFADDEWIVVTPEGYYNASANGDRHLVVKIGTNVYGIDNYREMFFRPDLVKVALAGGSLKSFPAIADIKLPPKVSIVRTPETSNSAEVKITVKLEEQGGGIGDVRLFLNGSAVLLDNGRGIKVVEKNDRGATNRSYTLKLTAGENIIRAIAFNGDNTMQSNPAERRITATFQSKSKPALHALVIGIQEFKNPKLELKYSVADANLFADALQKSAEGLFENVTITRLISKEATTKDAILASFRKYQALNPDDLFILYVASHGTVDDGEYFLLTANVGATSSHKLKSDAINQADLKELVANIPATKKMIVIDTCNAGKLGETLQVAMLTRGMSEDTAMKVLSRAVGSTILSAATSVQEALEGYQGHGLFTWALVEGILGKADKGKSGYVKTTDLATYVEDEVPNLAERVFKRAQYPTVMINGQGFPIGKVQ